MCCGRRAKAKAVGYVLVVWRYPIKCDSLSQLLHGKVRKKVSQSAAARLVHLSMALAGSHV